MEPTYGGNSGEPVPEVAAGDIKSVWEVGRRIQSEHPGCAVGASIYEMACTPGANIEATHYRASMLMMVQHGAPELLEPWTKNDQLDDVVFRAIGEVPMEWMGVGKPRKGLPFDVEDFLRRVREAA